MVNRDLLKEAIADAKAVKETAIANAKAALEESFGPYLKEKLAAKLAEMDNMDEDESVEEGKMKEKEMKENYNMDEDEMVSEDDMMEDETMEGKKEMDEMDLDELLRELESMDEDDMMEDETMEEGKAAYEYEKGKKAGEKEAMNEEEDLLNNPKGSTAHGNVAEEEKDDEVKASEDEEIDIENMNEDDLKSFIESVIADMVTAGELEGNIEAKDEMGDEGDEEVKASEEEKVEVKEGDCPSGVYYGNQCLDETKIEKVEEDKDCPSGVYYGMQCLDEAKLSKPLKIEKGAKLKTPLKITKGLEEAEKMKKEMDEMKKELDEAYSALTTIKSELNEVNLFNAKLLYTNKIFKAKNLTESQKVKVLAAFDKAASVKEAKLVFETLSEGFKEKKSPVNESLLRGSASKPTGVAEKKPILEVNNQFARWQTLAGIKK